MFWTVIGSIAATLTTFSFIPQIIRALKTKSVKDVSVVTILQLALGVTLWVVYGVHLRNPIIVIANSVTFVTLVILLAIYYKFRKGRV
ncbi:MAG: SemiSWEET transporter [bacterium]